MKVSQLRHYIPALSQSFSKAGPLYGLSPLQFCQGVHVSGGGTAALRLCAEQKWKRGHDCWARPAGGGAALNCSRCS